MHVFDIIGPIMIGPSSSHTAGAARIGRVARHLLGEQPVRAVIAFHGSFAKTYQGHGTDKAVVGGLMDMAVDDARIRDSLRLAHEAGMRFQFETVELKDAHANTALIQAWAQDGRHIEVQAASVGGGSIRVEKINGLQVNFTGEQNTLIITHRDEPGAIAHVTGELAGEHMNIATMQVVRRQAGGEAIMVIETDGLPGKETLCRLKQLPDISSVTLLERL